MIAGRGLQSCRGVSMVFSSVLFLFRFLPAFMVLYFAASYKLAPRRMKNIILFLGSLIFYAWGEPVYVVLMLFSTVSDYVHGRAIDTLRGRKAAKWLLASSVLINLAMLGFFKYADFLIGAVNGAFGTDIPLLNLPLPIGISFYTFQTMSYTIDVYRGEAKVQKNLLDFGVFVTMFPQLIAGPIVKYTDVQDDLYDRRPDIEEISRGMRRFTVGLAKKVLLANNIGILWEEISSYNYSGMNIMTAWMGILAFAFQIYFDFSGYSDMAIGLGGILGFHFPENFRYPYISCSVTEFWRRWHISLSSWFRDYVYIPLGGNRRGLGRQMLNILIVWTLTGIWHGAGWNFLLWGLWFAFFLILEKMGIGELLKSLPRVFGFLYTAAVVLVGWVFFSVESLGGSIGYLKAMFGLNGAGWYDTTALYLGREYLLLFLLAAVSSLPVLKRIADRLEASRSGYGIAVCRLCEKVIPAALFIASMAYIVDASYNPFLYFRF